MLGLDRATARVTWTALLVILLIAFVYAVRDTLLLFAVATLFACLLYPLVDLLEKAFPPRNRVPALAVSYLLVLCILTAIGGVIGSHVVAEARQLIASPPDVRGFLLRLQASHPALTPIIDAAHGRLRDQLGDLVSAAPRISLRVVAASANLIDLVVVPILSFFILKDGRAMREAFLALFHEGPGRAAAEQTIGEIHTLLIQYMRSLFLLCCTVLVVFGVVLNLMGVPYAILLACVAFLCEFVPLMGPISAAALILSVSAIGGYPHFWWIAGFLAVFRIVQDYVVTPKLMSRGIELHPILVIFGVFAGAEIGGVAGVFLSIPLLALARMVLRRGQAVASNTVK